MERIGILGGSFNPPHIGHIQSACHAADALGLDKVLLIPYWESPHRKWKPEDASPDQRMDMVRLAAQADPRLEACDLELRSKGMSYTSDTLTSLHDAYPDAQFTLLMGSDMLASLPKWKNSDTVMALADLAVLSRGGKKEQAVIASAADSVRAMGGRVSLLANPVCEISSTQIRRLIAFGCGWEFLDPAAAAFIRSQGLYDVNANWKALPMEQLEPIVIRLLNPNRVRHVLGCRDAAVELARRWGADETDAARAGLLHDITKALDGPLQLTLCSAYGKILDDFSQRYPKTLHALTGSLVAERIFGENERVVSAICSHTTGKADMNLLETIIYVADYMEPNRDFPGVEKLRQLAYSNLPAALQLGLEMTLDHLKDQGSEVSPQSREALNYLYTHLPERKNEYVES